MAKDITKQGVSPITGLRYDPSVTPEQRAETEARLGRIAQLDKLRRKGINISYSAPIGSMTESTPYEPGSVGAQRGMSKYDRKGDQLTPVTSFDELNQHRYDEQPWWDTMANGIIKTAGRAATSFISSMIGGIAGLATAGYNVANHEKDWWKGFWDNPLSNAMADIDDYFNENFTNYQSLTQQQNSRNGEWWKNMSGLNMWMDDVLTNTGFTLGMIAASMTGAGLLGAAGKMIKGAELAKKWGQAAKALTLLNSTAGESATEALGAKREHEQAESQRINDYFDQQVNADPQVQRLDAAYQQTLAQLDQDFGYQRNDPQYQQHKARLDQAYQQQRGQLSAQYEQRRQASLDQMKDEANHLGLAVGLGNMAILGISNFNLAGRFVDKAYRNAVKNTGKSWAAKNGEIKFKNAFGQSNVITRTAADGSKRYGSRTWAGNVGKRAASNMLSEGVYEEMGQGALSTGAKSYYAYEDIDNYWRARLDPDSVDRTADGSHDFLAAVGNGLKETYGSADGWKEGFIGGITGMLFSAGETRDEWRNTRFAKRAARDLNNALADPKTTQLLRHFVAQGHHAANKDRLAEQGNQSDWKTEDDKAMFALVSTFRRAGKMDDLHEMIKMQSDELRNMSDNDLSRLVSDSTKITTADEQRIAAKQSIQDETNKAIEGLLVDGAELGDVTRAQEAVAQAKNTEQQAVRAQQLAEQNAQRVQHDRKATRFQINSAREQSRRATAAQQKATRAVRKAEQELNGLFKENSGLRDMERLLGEQERRSREVDGTQFTELYSGPFVDPDGNRMTAEQIREQLQHNLDKTQEVIGQYQKTVEDINMQTRGLFDKEQEDYLAYASFLDKTHTTRAEGLVKKWRGVLPETLRMEVPKGKAKKLAKALGIAEGSVQEDPDNEGMAIVNTKDFTDEQWSAFMLDGYIGNSHMSKVDGEGNTIDDLTEKFRAELRDKALKAVEDEMARTGRKKDFNRDQFVRDMEDAGAAYGKATAFRDAFAKAMADPESILTSREKFLRNLKKSWARKKAKLMQKRMSVEQLGDLSDEQLKELDTYHFMLAKAEKTRRAIKRFWDSQLPRIHAEIEEAFEDITDPELRLTLINRMKDRIDEYIQRFQEEGTGEIEDVELDMEALKAHISLDDILPEDDPLWSRIDDKTKAQIKKGINSVKRLVERIPTMYRRAVNYWKKKYDNLRKPGSEAAEEDDDSGLLDKAADLLRRAKLSDKNKEDIGKLLDTIRKRIGELSSRDFPGRDRIVGALKKAAKRLDDALKRATEAKTPDTDPVVHPPQGHAAQQQSAPQQAPAAAPVRQSETGSDSIFQNPGADELETKMRLAVREHTDDDSASDVGSNIWQSVTGEYARRSNFTYRPYHEIVEEYLAQWDKELDDKEKAERKLHVMEFGPYSRDRSYNEWVRYAKRSRAVYDYLTQHNAFGYIDRGNIKSGDQINFRIFKTDDGELIVYLEHNGQVFGDLNHPDYGAADVEGLKEIYEEFAREYEAAADKKDGVVSSLHTTAANIFSGFPKFLGSNLEGEVETQAVADLGEAADGIEFHIVGVSSTTELRGRGKAGQPMIVLKRPGNSGLTRKLAVPVTTKGMTEGGIELQVMQAAALKFKDDPKAFAQFLKHFIKSHDVHTEVIQQTDEQGEMRPVLQVKITGDYVDSATRRRAAAVLSFSMEDGSLLTGHKFLPTLRANVSAHLLGERRLSQAPTWEQVVEGTNLPSYKDFLKQVCHTNLADPLIHNSWVTLNKLVKNEQGAFVEQSDPTVEETVTFTRKGNPVVRVQNLQDGVTYLVEFAQDEAVDPDDEDSDLAPIVVGISGVRGKGKPTPVRITPANQDKLLTIMAQAVVRKGGVSRSDFNFFKLNGLTYKFYLSQGSSNAITRVDYADVQSDINAAANLSDQVLNKPQLRAAFRHYNGTAKSMRSILKEWFSKGRTAEAEPLLLAVLDDIAKGRTRVSLSQQQCITLLNALDYDKRNSAERRRAIAQKLIDHLKDKLAGKGITITQTTDLEKALLEDANSRLHSEGEEAVNDGGNRRYFISASGSVVYGFVQDHPDGTSTIYLDSDLLNPETVAHEYTHLWVSIFRKVDPKGWQRLVAELKTRNRDIWDKVSRKYGNAVRVKKTVNGKEEWVEDDDKIADEVFAHATGRRAEKLLGNDEGLPGNVSADTLKDIWDHLKSIINSVLSFVFGRGSYANVMEELVLQDMLSDDPLTQFDPHIVDISEEYGAKETTTEGGTPAEGGTTAEQGPTAREGYVLMPLDAFDSPRQLRRKGYTIIGDQVEVPAGMTDDELSNIGWKRKSRSHISLDDDVESPLAANLLRLRRADPLFDGLHKHLPAMDKGLQRGWLSGDNFLLAARLLLTEGQRNTLWEAARQELGGRVGSNVELAAQIGVLFNDRLNGTSSGNAVMDKVFGELRTAVENAVAEPDTILRAEDEMLRQDDSAIVPMPTDPLSNLSRPEQIAVHDMVLDHLSEADLEHLAAAGYSAHMFHQLTRESKERIRRCVL